MIGHRCWLSECGGKPRWRRSNLHSTLLGCVNRKTWLHGNGDDPFISSSFLCNQAFPHTLSNSVQWLDCTILGYRFAMCGLESKVLRPKTHGSKVRKLAANFVCFWAEISVQSPAFPGPKSRPRVQQFQNAPPSCITARQYLMWAISKECRALLINNCPWSFWITSGARACPYPYRTLLPG